MKTLSIITFIILLSLSSCYFDLYPFNFPIEKEQESQLTINNDSIVLDSTVKIIIDKQKEIQDSLLKRREFILDSLSKRRELSIKIERDSIINVKKENWNKRKQQLRGREPETYWIGMTNKQAIISLREPHTITRIVKESITYEEWNYTGCYREDLESIYSLEYSWKKWHVLILYFENNILVSWKETIN